LYLGVAPGYERSLARVLVSVLDVTDLKRAEQALRASEQRYRSLFEDTPLPLWEEDFSKVATYFENLRTSGITDLRAYLESHPEAVADCAGLVKIVDVNRATLALVGAKDKKELLAGLLPHGFTETSLKAFVKELISLAEGDRYFESEAVYQALTGEEQFITLHLSVAPGYERSLGKVLVSMFDITERKKAEAEREALIAELEAKNTELERFTYTVSHDLKSPLITIQGFLGFLEQDALAGNVEQMQADIARVVNAAEKMEQLLNELLELSRIGRLMNPPEETPLGELAREAVSMVGGRLAQRGVVVDIAPDLPMVYGDRPRLRQVLENLVDNAVKYLGDQPHPRVEIGARRDGGEIVFYVRDNGMGIDPCYHQKIFGLFEKLNPKSEGTGVGLAIVKRIVEVHGGRIWVESQGEEKGSTLCFTLPHNKEAMYKEG